MFRSLIYSLILLWLTTACLPLVANPTPTQTIPHPPTPTAFEEGLAPEIQPAYRLLRTTAVFSGAEVGVAATTPDTVQALRLILKDPAAESIFKQLLVEATPAGQLYALAALYVINPEFARLAAKPYESNQAMVQTQFGCINAEMPISEVTMQILDGTLPRALAGAEMTPTASTKPTLPPPVPTSGERPCLPAERLPAVPDPNGPSFHQVLIATSSDGLTWQTNHQVVIDQASVPEVVRLPDGRWLIYAVNGSMLGGPGFVYAESQDEGQTWTCGIVNVTGADPDVVLLPDGRIRIYYIEFPFGPNPPQPGTQITEPNRVRSAISLDGKNFTIEEGARLEGIGYTDPDVILVGNEWFMYVSTGEKAWAARSSDGLNFTLIGLVNDTGAVSGSYLFPDGTLRHYYCGRQGIQSATSTGGGDRWRAEPGTRIARDPAWATVCDPSVVSDGHGGYWMAYKIQPADTTTPSP